MCRAAVILALAFSLVSPAGATSRSGLFGVVMRGPVTPVCIAGTPCDAPAAGVTLVFRHGGVAIGRVVTGRAGSYRIALQPGVYAVQGPKRMTPLIVKVIAGRFTQQNFTVDTGIR